MHDYDEDFEEYEDDNDDSEEFSEDDKYTDENEEDYADAKRSCRDAFPEGMTIKEFNAYCRRFNVFFLVYTFVIALIAVMATLIIAFSGFCRYQESRTWRDYPHVYGYGSYAGRSPEASKYTEHTPKSNSTSDGTSNAENDNSSEDADDNT